MKYNLEFEAPDDWKPMEESACWVDCPLKTLTRLGMECRAREAYRKRGDILCPIIKLKNQSGTSM